MSNFYRLRKLLSVTVCCLLAASTFAQSVRSNLKNNIPPASSTDNLPDSKKGADFRNLSVAAPGGSPTSVTATPGSICAGSSVSLTATCSTGTVVWYNQASGGTSIGSGSPLSQSPTVSTTYYAACNFASVPTRVTVSESARVATSQVTVTNVGSPTGVSVSQTSLCMGSSVSLAATCASGTVTWYNQATGGSAIGTGTGLSQSPTVNTTYYGSCESGSCASGRVAANQVVVAALPTAPAGISVNKTTVRSSEKIILTATCLTGTVVWYNQASGGNEIGAGTSIAYYPTQNTTFYTSCRNGNCESSRTATSSEVSVTNMAQVPYMVKDINSGSMSSYPESYVNVNGTLFFSVYTENFGVELWKTDGTPQGTMIVKDIVAGTGSSDITQLTKVGNRVFFTASVSGSSQLWVSNGEESGTFMVKQLSVSNFIFDVNGTAFFVGDDYTGTGSELWKSDGTTVGTVMVKDIGGNSVSSLPMNPVNVNGILFFSAVDETNGRELWKSDGTADGTVLVKDIRAGTQNSNLEYLTNVNGKLYFSATDGISGIELWISDGTSSGTRMVKDIRSGSLGSGVSSIIEMDGIAYMIADDGSTGKELWRSDGTEGGTYLVKDIWQGGSGSYIEDLVKMNNALYFVAKDGVSGKELWKSNGTEDGTSRVKDINSGSNDSFTVEQPIVNAGGYLYFIADNGENGIMLWKSDGTDEGTMPVEGFGTGPSASSIQYLTDVNGKLYFSSSLSAENFDFGNELFSLGTCTDANQLVSADGRTIYFNSQQNTDNGFESCYCDVSNRLISKVVAANLLTAATPMHAREWIDEVAPDGFVRRHYAINSDNSADLIFAAGKITLYFTQADFDNYNLNVADGEPKLPADSSDLAGKDYLSIVQYGEVNDETGLPENFDNVSGRFNPKNADIVWNSAQQRWEVSFTAEGFGQFFVKAAYTFTEPDDIAISATNICAGQTVILSASCGGLGTPIWYDYWLNPIGSGSPLSVTAVNDNRYFVSCKVNDGETETDKFETEPGRIATFVPQVVSVDKTTIVSGAKVTLSATCDNGMVVWYNQANGGSEIGLGSSIVYYPGTNTVFYASCRTATCETSRVATNEVNVTTLPLLPYVVKDIYPGSDPSYPSNFVNMNGTVFFTALTPGYGEELWKSDGTAEGTVMVKDIAEADASPQIGKLTKVGNKVFFTTEGTTTPQLWVSNGEEDSTYVLKEINSVSFIIDVNGTAYFGGDDGSGIGNELWKSDGTVAGTVQVKDIQNGVGDSNPATPANVNGVLFFSADDGINGKELWKSDGTMGGTVLVKDIKSGALGSYLTKFTAVKDKLYFVANDGTSGDELWISDGTPGGTKLVKDIRIGSGESGITSITEMGGIAYMIANDGIKGSELWRSNGTGDSTYIVKDIREGSGSSSISNLVKRNGFLYFGANDDVVGKELWRSNGTGEGTSLVKDISEGPDGSLGSSPIVNVDGTLYFIANNGLKGVQLWKSDGSAEGTMLVKDIDSEPSSTVPENLANVNGKLYFNSDPSDGSLNVGTELWSLGTCTEVNKIINTSGKTTFFNSQPQPTSDTLTCYCDIFNKLITTIRSTGGNPVSGDLEVREWVDETPAETYVRRHYEIYSSNDPTVSAAGTARITLYFTQADFDAYNNALGSDAPKLPTTSDDVTGKANISIARYKGSGDSDTGAPETYSVEPVLINPANSDIAWNNSLERWEVTFATEGLGGYFIKAVIQEPESVSVSSTSICLNASVTLNATCETGTVVWYNQASGGTSIGTGSPFVHSPSGTTTYYAACEMAGNASERIATDEVVVTNQPTDKPAISVSKTAICSGESITLTASCTTGDVVWYNQASGGSSIGSGTSLSVSPGTPSATYYASCEIGSCVSDRDESELITVTTIPSAPTDVAASQNAICSGTAISLTASCTSSTITWYNQATGGSAIGTGTGLSQSPAVNTTYYASCKTGSCESSRVAIASQVVVTTMPSNPTGVSASQNTICSGTAISLTASCTSSTITWYNQATGGSAIGTGTGLSQSPTVNTTYYASCKTGSCESSRVAIASQVVVATTPAGPTGVSASQSAICSGTSITLTASCTSSTITWYNQATGGSAIGTGTGLSQSPTVSTTYYASCKTGNCESSRVAIASQVVVTTIPSAPTGVTASQSAICSGTAISLAASCTSSTVVWYNVPNGGNSLGTGTGLSQSPVVSTTYYAACLNGSCESARVATEAVTVTTTPAKPVISGINEVCEGETIVLTASSTNSNLTGIPVYYWTGGSTGVTLSITPSGIKMYKVMAVFSGCVSDSSDAFTVYPYERPPAPVITADNATMCKGETVVLTATCPSQGNAFYWVSENARPAIPVNPMYRNARNISAPGTYKGYCMSYGGCKSSETSITITQDAECGIQRFITVTPDKPVICPGSSVTLSASGCTGIITWTGGPTIITGTSATFSPGTTTSYLVQCSTGGNASVTVSVAPVTTAVTKNISTGTSQVKAVNTIEADKKVGDPNYTPSPKVSYEAGKSILLKPGFVAEAGTVFKAEIKACN